MPSRYKAKPQLKIDGQQYPEKLMEDLLQISVEESLHLPSMFTIVIRNSLASGRPNDELWQHESLFKIGSVIEIGFTSSTTEASEFQEQTAATVMIGEVTAIEAHFTTDSQVPIIIRGYDRSHRLHRGHYNRSFQNMTDTDIVQKVIGEVGLAAGTIDSSGAPHAYVFQENQTNMEFLRERAARNGFELFMQDDKLHFRQPKKNASLNLKWQQELTSFQVRVTSAEQVSEVNVQGWDYKQKRPFFASRPKETLLTQNQHGNGQKTSTAFQGSPKLILVGQPMATQQEADKMAKALCYELGDEFIQADAQAGGDPSIRPGKVVKLEDMGKYSGDYYITETHHLFSEGNYTTGFSIRGLRGGDLFTLLSPPSRPRPGQTLLIGIVTNNKDPEKMGRVRVKFPTLTDGHESDWARVVAIGAGKSRGFDCLPEINDEVLVGFEHGNIHRPFVIGGLWNGQDTPPTNVDDSVVSGQVRLRTFQTRTGHQLQFIEEDKGGSKKGIQITSKEGHQICINDTDKTIDIKTSGGHKAKLDDQNKKIELSSSNGHTITLDPKGVSLDSKGSVTIKAATTLDIQASGPVSVKGAVIRLN